MKKKLAIIVAFAAILMFSIFYGFTDKTHLIYNNDVNTATYTAIGVLGDSDVVTQRFISEEDVLDGFSIKSGVAGNHSAATVYLTVKDTETGKVLSTGSDSGANFRPRKMHKIFTDKISGVKGKELILEITEKGADPDNGIILYYQTLTDTDSSFQINGNDVNGVFVMKTITSRFDAETFIIILLSILFVWGFLWFLHRLFSLNDHSKKESKKPKFNVFLKLPLNRNMGEDMIAEEVMRRYPNTTFHIISDEGYMRRFDCVPNCRVCAESSLDFKERTEEAVKAGFADLNDSLIKNSDAVVKLGNTLFLQTSEDYQAALNEDRYLSDNSKRFYTLGTDFGPYKDAMYFKEYKSVFRKYAGITFRNSNVKDNFADMDNIRFAPDPLFTVRPGLLAQKSPKAIISPLLPTRHAWGKDMEDIVEPSVIFYRNMIRTLKKNGYLIYMISFSQPEGDDVIMQMILDSLSPDELAQVTCCMAYSSDPVPVLREFSDAQIVIGSRYHSIVLGLTYGCKVLPIVYNEQTKNLLHDISYDLSVTPDMIKNPDTDTDAIFEKLIAGEIFDLTVIKQRAEHQFWFLDMLLRK